MYYSIIIYAYNNSNGLKKCIESIYQYKFTDNFEVIIVNDASRDGICEYLDTIKLQYLNLIVIDNTERIGIVKSRNIGSEISRGEYLIFINSNTVVYNEWDLNLINSLKINQSTGISGPKITTPMDTIQSAGIYIQNSESVLFPFKGMPSNFPLANIETDCSCISGICLAFKKSDFIKYGKFNEKYTDDYVNLDICLRFKEKGYKVIYQPKSVIKQTEFIDFSNQVLSYASEYTFRKSWNTKIIPDEYSLIKKNRKIACNKKLIDHVEFYEDIDNLKKLKIEHLGTHSVCNSALAFKKKHDDSQIVISIPEIKTKPEKYYVFFVDIYTEYSGGFVKLFYQTKSEPFYCKNKLLEYHLNKGRSLCVFNILAEYLNGNIQFTINNNGKSLKLYSIQIYSFNKIKSHINPLVSVIIPYYNHGSLLTEAIESVEKTENKDIYEIIIVNDGSTDTASIEILNNLEQNGYNIIHQTNQKLGAARNNGISIAKGKYILPLDSDNKIRPFYIKRGIEVLEMHPDVGVVYGNSNFFGAVNRINKVPEFDPVYHFKQNTIDACAMFKKELWEEIGGYKENMIGYQDWEFWMAIASLKIWRFYHLNSVVFDYRVSGDSMVTNTRKFHEYIKDQMCSYHIRFFRNTFEEIESNIRILDRINKKIAIENNSLKNDYKIINDKYNEIVKMYKHEQKTWLPYKYRDFLMRMIHRIKTIGRYLVK